MSSLLARTKARLIELNMEPDRALGQNFLVSDLAIQKIIAAVENLNPDYLLEIGPGLGALTDQLQKMARPLTLIELDRDLAAYWRKLGAQVVEADAIKIDWSPLASEPNGVLVSNLPYQISTHIVVDRCLGPQNIVAMVLMFQKEVAERLLAKPRTSAYGLLSVMVQSFFKVERLLEAGTKDFWPSPKVASQVVVFKRLPSPVAGLNERFLKFLKAAFAQRRKYLSKNLVSVPLAADSSREKIEKAMAELDLDAKVRAEELSVEQFQKLFLKLVDEWV